MAANHLIGNIERYMNANWLTQLGAAQAFGLKKFAVRDLLKHPERTTRPATVAQMAKRMGVSPEELVGKKLRFSQTEASDGSVPRSRQGRRPGRKPGRKPGRRLRATGIARSRANGEITANGALIDLALRTCGYELPDKRGKTAGEVLAEAIVSLKEQVRRIAGATI